MIRDRFDDFKTKAVGLVPQEMKELLKKVGNDVPLTDAQYSSVINFFKQRRRRQLEFEFRKPRTPNEKSAFIEDLIKKYGMFLSCFTFSAGFALARSIRLPSF